jgi:hypothetical protein
MVLRYSTTIYTYHHTYLTITLWPKHVVDLGEIMDYVVTQTISSEVA